MTYGEAGPPREEGGAARPRRWRLRVPVKESLRLHADHHRLVLSSREIAAAARPGQFLHVWPHAPEDIVRPPFGALLRRPYSISAVSPPDEVEVLLRMRGTGGKLVASKQAGDMLDVIGPLGNGFRIRDGLTVAVVVAGGVGLAPAPFIIERLVASGARVIVMAGAADDRMVPFAVDRPRAGRASIPALAALGAEVTFISEEVEGILVTEVLEARLGEFPTDGSAEVFGIGPRAMLKRLSYVTGAHFQLQVSLEERMACGVGACRSCVVPTQTHSGFTYQTVCRDGPVFLASDIDWERLEP